MNTQAAEVAHAMHVVTEEQWERIGFKDAQHGNTYFPPRVGHSTALKASRDAYVRGWKRYKAERS